MLNENKHVFCVFVSPVKNRVQTRMNKARNNRENTRGNMSTCCVSLLRPQSNEKRPVFTVYFVLTVKISMYKRVEKNCS